ncbi:hypothetical protein [Pseudoxanthomonas kaohsiungensis]|uniref:Actin-like protein N-terminal domain-containing protein n=1 Tax=Pseudoxanthomonas kaohsiungensis TaxID=283923 RepID=A0ABW3LXB2_9GAMM|nr:hypothetical protein [Pseudoxanthomonas kaohsiungensis]
MDLDSVVTFSCRTDSGPRHSTVSYVRAIECVAGSVHAYSTEGRPFLIHRAELEASPDALTSAEYRVRVVAELARSMPPGAAQAMLVTGMAMGAYFDEGGAARDDVLEVENSLSIPVLDARGQLSATTSVGQVRVLPRTVCAFMDWALSDDAEVRSEAVEAERVLVVDVAMNATSIAGFDATTQALIDSTYMEIPIGWARAARLLRNEIQVAHNCGGVHLGAVVEALRHGQYHYRGDAWSCVETLVSAFGDLGRHAAAWVDQVQAGDESKKFKVVVSGLGGAFLTKALGALGVRDPYCPINPEASNARGMLKFGLLAIREGL